MEEKRILQILLGEFHTTISRLKDLIPRDATFANAPDKIKVAIGMRRTGKTYFMYQYILKLLKSTQAHHILYINFDDDRLLPLTQEKLAKLVDAFYSLYPENHDKKCYFFFDEIQNVDNWPLVIRRLHSTKNVEIFLTGSSAKLLSKEISTHLRGRSLATEIWPYSFQEFLRAEKVEINRTLYDKKTQDTLTKLFKHYLTVGGFPEVISYQPDTRIHTLQEYVDVVIYRDIVERHSISNSHLLKYLIFSRLANISSPFSINKFYNDAQSQGHKGSKDILYEYADHIEDAYLSFSISLYSKSIRKVQTNPKKIYAIDPGLVGALTLRGENNFGKLFENVIFLDLRRMGCSVHYYLTLDRYEIDFLIQTPEGKKKLLQVVWDQNDQTTAERELRALESAKKELKIEGNIITLDSYLSEGIKL